MRSLLVNTFGGLSGPVYLRHFLFGAVIAALLITISLSGKHTPNFGFIVFVLINTSLYPYSRFVYESVVGYIVGHNTFYWEAGAFIWAKCVTVTLCWAFAIFIAPVGLIYLFFRNKNRSAV